MSYFETNPVLAVQDWPPRPSVTPTLLVSYLRQRTGWLGQCCQTPAISIISIEGYGQTFPKLDNLGTKR